MGEGGLLETAVNVPARPTHICAALAPVIGDPEDVSVRRLWVIVECGLYLAEPSTHSQVELRGDMMLVFEHEDPVLGHVPPNHGDHLLAQALRQLDAGYLASQFDLPQCVRT